MAGVVRLLSEMCRSRAGTQGNAQKYEFLDEGFGESALFASPKVFQNTQVAPTHVENGRAAAQWLCRNWWQALQAAKSLTHIFSIYFANQVILRLEIFFGTFFSKMFFEIFFPKKIFLLTIA